LAEYVWSDILNSSDGLLFPTHCRHAMTKTLNDLVAFLDSLEQRAPLAQLMAELADLRVDCDELGEHLRFSDQQYARNLVRTGPWYQLLVLCWKNGQRSPIHDHAGSTCGVRVLRGVMTETTFDFTPNGHVKAIGSRDLAEGQVCGTQDDDLHQISNLQAGEADLVTLHVYTPPLVWMGTYSMYDTSRGQERMLLEFSDAAGI
jgi:cysteine dioxygenase